MENNGVTLPKGGENRKTSKSIKQQDNTKSAQFISNKQISKYSNVLYKRQFTGNET